jgi:hypothetical protein
MPLHLGQIVVNHRGDWPSDLTKNFEDIIVHGFILDSSNRWYESIAVIKAKEGEFTEKQKERVRGYINLHNVKGQRTIRSCRKLLETGDMLALQLKVKEHIYLEPLIRPIQAFGGTLIGAIGHVADNGVERINAFYPNRERWNFCMELFKRVYKDDFIERKCKFYNKAGLAGDPPLLAESLLCSKVKLATQRIILDSYLKGEYPSASEEEIWQKEIFKTLAKIVKEAPKYKPAVTVVVKLLFGMEVDP